LPQGTALSEATAAALRKAASSNLSEIESSRLALGRSQSSPIKQFAERIVDD
jgi:predicted outer membrane protein